MLLVTATNAGRSRSAIKIDIVTDRLQPARHEEGLQDYSRTSRRRRSGREDVRRQSRSGTGAEKEPPREPPSAGTTRRSAPRDSSGAEAAAQHHAQLARERQRTRCSSARRSTAASRRRPVRLRTRGEPSYGLSHRRHRDGTLNLILRRFPVVLEASRSASRRDGISVLRDRTHSCSCIGARSQSADHHRFARQDRDRDSHFRDAQRAQLLSSRFRILPVAVWGARRETPRDAGTCKRRAAPCSTR